MAFVWRVEQNNWFIIQVPLSKDVSRGYFWCDSFSQGLPFMQLLQESSPGLGTKQKWCYHVLAEQPGAVPPTCVSLQGRLILGYPSAKNLQSGSCQEALKEPWSQLYLQQPPHVLLPHGFQLQLQMLWVFGALEYPGCGSGALDSSEPLLISWATQSVT